ncbi:ABC1-domain-containing protein [Scleroderma citrinum]
MPPPGPVLGWLCVAHSVVDIALRAAHISCGQVLPRKVVQGSLRREEKYNASREESSSREDNAAAPGSTTDSSSNALVSRDESCFSFAARNVEIAQEEASHVTTRANTFQKVAAFEDVTTQTSASQLHISTTLQSSKVPSSRIGRFFHYGGLVASLGYGAAAEILRRSSNSSDGTDGQRSSIIMTEANIKRLVSKLSQMRGAALKLGQFMSIQDTYLLPPELDEIFRRVQNSAHYMPDWQMEEVLRSSLGPSWATNFAFFERIPFAAASIGQVHHAVLAASASPTGREERVAVKIQFPNIAASIASDLGYVKMLLTSGRLLPKGLFLDRTIEVMTEELADECDYSREADFIRRYHSPERLGQDSRFKIPWVWKGSTQRVLVMECMDGVVMGDAMVSGLPQKDRDEIASRIIELCLRELFEFRMMQTDPNWTNFLWNPRTKQVSLIDFGATREYTKEFMDKWLRLLQAAADEDRGACARWSLELGYLTGKENETMLNAHVSSMIMLGTPFRDSSRQAFAFGPGSQWTEITAQIRAQIPTMLSHRLTPPPRETYSLNRKLSGAFLLATRLQAVVNTKELWNKVTNGYRFG